MLFVYGKNLDKNIRSDISNRVYSEEDLNKIYQKLNDEKTIHKDDFKIDAVTVLIAFGLLGYTMVKDDSELLDSAICVCSIGYVICMAILYRSLFKKRKKQFLKAVKKGYPELVEKYK